MAYKYRSYWFVNGNLHKFIRRVTEDIVETFDFDDNCYKEYYVEVWNSSKQKAYTLSDMGEFFNRSLETMRRWSKNDEIQRGHMAWSLVNPDKPVAEFWTEEGVWAVWRYARTQHIGRPNKRGIINSKVLSAKELRAKLNGDKIVYVKKDGELFPVWKEII